MNYLCDFCGNPKNENTMKKTMTKTITKALFLLFAGILLTGCDPDDFKSGTEMYTHQFTVEANHWEWNQLYNRYEYIWNWEEMDNYMYEQGVVTAGVYMWEKLPDGSDYEVLRSLPFVHTYSDRAGTYTRTIGFDISGEYVAFYLQSSDLGQTHAAPQSLAFKVTLFWEK
jgi:hypothetical protein